MIALLLATAMAHVPNIASYTLQGDAGYWALDVTLSTDGMHRAMKQLHPDEKLSEVSVTTYQRYLVDALRAGVHLKFDATEVALGEATVSLAPHETRVHFDVPGPSVAGVVVAHIDALHQHGDQHNVFRVTTAGRRAHVVLSEDNGFAGEVVLDPFPAH